MDLFHAAGEDILHLETLSGLADAFGFASDDCRRLSALEMPVLTLVLFYIEVTGFFHCRIDLNPYSGVFRLGIIPVIHGSVHLIPVKASLQDVHDKYSLYGKVHLE